jgi:hypothetical protein
VPGELWHERLFLARIAEAPKREASDDFAGQFTRLLGDQRAYHHRVEQRRGRIAHRLHALATGSFILALLLTLAHVPLMAEGVQKAILETLALVTRALASGEGGDCPRRGIPDRRRRRRPRDAGNQRVRETRRNLGRNGA